MGLKQKSTALKILEILKSLMHLITQNVQNEFKEINLTGPQGLLLRSLAVNGEMRVSDLSEKMGLSNSTVSGIIDRLEKQDMVQRIRSREDRRVVKISINKEKCDVKEFEKKIDAKLQEIMNNASSQELDVILESLERLQQIFIESNKEKNNSKEKTLC